MEKIRALKWPSAPRGQYRIDPLFDKKLVAQMAEEERVMELRRLYARDLGHHLYLAEVVYMQRELLVRPGAQLDHLGALIPAGAPTIDTDVGQILANGRAWKVQFVRYATPSENIVYPDIKRPAYSRAAAQAVEASNHAITEGADLPGELADVTAELRNYLLEAFIFWALYRPFYKLPLAELTWTGWVEMLLG
jgi:hypothetical protein